MLWSWLVNQKHKKRFALLKLDKAFDCLIVTKFGDMKPDCQPYTDVNDPRFQVSDVFVQKQSVKTGVILVGIFSCWGSWTQNNGDCH